MERGLYMIEIIREESYDSEQEKRELPKNIRQIGSPDIGDRIYIENKVHEYMHPYDALQEKTVYVLLGRFENLIGRQSVWKRLHLRASAQCGAMTVGRIFIKN